MPTGRWERHKLKNAPQTVFGYGATLAWLPTKKLFSVYKLEDEFRNYDFEAKTWNTNKPEGKFPNCRDYEGISCYDTKRNRLVVFNRRGSQPQGRFGIFDEASNRWLEVNNTNNPEEQSGGSYDSYAGCAHYDSANDVAIVWLDRKAKPGAYVYDIAKDQWVDGPVAIGKRNGVTAFYCPEVNAHIYFDAGDSHTEPGKMWAWRYKNPAK